jgi:hypothetical protein
VVQPAADSTAIQSRIRVSFAPVRAFIMRGRRVFSLILL